MTDFKEPAERRAIRVSQRDAERLLCGVFSVAAPVTAEIVRRDHDFTLFRPREGGAFVIPDGGALEIAAPEGWELVMKVEG